MTESMVEHLVPERFKKSRRWLGSAMANQTSKLYCYIVILLYCYIVILLYCYILLCILFSETP
ncbi:MAG: hypothetical protein ACJA0H_002488 [Francisellaceae bacterium]|jgi:hypothetical protein